MDVIESRARDRRQRGVDFTEGTLHLVRVSHPACAADKHLNGDRSGDSTEQQETQSQCKGEPGFPGANHLNRYIGKRCPNTQQLTRSLAGGIALRRLKYHEALSS